MTSKKTRPCVFCDAVATGQGEHVWPRWFLAELEAREERREFTKEINGVPLRKRERDGGVVRTEPQMPRLLLPVCRDCNAWLENRYESSGADVVRSVLAGDPAVLMSEGTVETFARWVAKTLLLAHHPQVRDSFGPRAKELQQMVTPLTWDIPQAVMERWRATGLLPLDVSLWISIYDDTSTGGEFGQQLRVYLPTVDAAGLGLPAGTVTRWRRGDDSVLVLHLLFHPGLDVAHPFGASGLVTRLWPDPPPTVDLAGHPPLTAKGLAQLGHLFVAVDGAGGAPGGARRRVRAYADGEFPGWVQM